MATADALLSAKRVLFPIDRPAVDHLALPLEIEAGRWPALFRGLMISVTSAVGILLVLFAVAPIKELSVAEGQVVPEGSTLPVHHLEGGIVAAVLVKAGTVVEADQPILRMEPTAASSDLGQLAARRAGHLAAVIRLKALLAGTAPDFEAAGAATDSAVVENTALYRRERDALAKITETHDSRVVQRSATLAAAESELKSLQTQLAANAERLRLREQLMREGYASRNAYLDAQVQVEQVRARMAQVEGQITAGRGAVAEAKSQRAEAEATKHVEWSTELAKTTAELAEVEQMIAKTRDRVDRLFVRAPVRGIVQDLVPKSPGDVLKPGEPAAHIVPLDGRLLVETRLDPQDSGYVRIGHPARIKLTAFDPEAFGPIQGTVVDISPTTFTNDKGVPFYKATLSLSHTTVTRGRETHQILPGMVARAEIVTGEKSVLRYLLKPIFRSVDLAFSER
ncbi:HlyD family type I secretion periplasmic adaptor subunit [Prosthecomicrobium sp. N25]|uniref:HlyD family type I secretion periplasmic adaptor subunit n=1 Tax=Prosthecomicrobium sp. N25 TaxID=3129254 RepID=UPI003077B883